jgi:hypothetical protein
MNDLYYAVICDAQGRVSVTPAWREQDSQMDQASFDAVERAAMEGLMAGRFPEVAHA